MKYFHCVLNENLVERDSTLCEGKYAANLWHNLGDVLTWECINLEALWLGFLRMPDEAARESTADDPAKL